MSTQATRLTLSDLATIRPLSGTVNLRGKEISVRPPTPHEQNLLRLNHLAPVPPQWKNPNKGSLAEMEPNYDDADFVAKSKAHSAERNMLLAAIAIGYTPQPTRTGVGYEHFVEAVNRNGGAAEWIGTTLKELQGTDLTPAHLNSPDVGKIMGKVQELESGAPGVGNSSAPSDGATPATTSLSPAPAESPSKTPRKGASAGETTASS